jgi:hypothetical protein
VKSILAAAMFVALLSLSAVADDKDGVVVAPPSAPVAQPAVASNFANNAIAPATITPAAPVSPVVLKKPELQHNFFDRTNLAGLGLLGAGLTGDALSTQKGLGLPGFHEINPIARPFVQSRAGAAFYSAASFSLMSGGMYFMHKSNHHKIERVLPFALAGWEGFLTLRNYHLINSSTRTH